ncbi:MAG: hypothetical protein CMH52_13020 [Myxococcales bacterium]|nr:hypothetical protein [Myxococcales bacterium]
MMPCTACGYSGEPNRLNFGQFELAICAKCGFGVGLAQPASDAAAVDAEPRIEKPSTSEVELSPTSAFTVADLTEASASANASGQAIIVTNDEETYGVIDAAFNEFDAIGCVFADKGTGAIELVMSRFESPDSTGVLIDTQNDDYSAVELGYAIRAIETGLGAKKSDIIFFGEVDSAAEVDVRRIGATIEIGSINDQLAVRLANSIAERMI